MRSVENHRIFLVYCLVYLLPSFLYFILFPFCFILLYIVSLYYVILTHSIKKNIIFFSHFIWYQSHDWFWSEPSFPTTIFLGGPSLSDLLHRTFSIGPSPLDLLRQTFSIETLSNGPSPMDPLQRTLSGGPSSVDPLQ